MLKKLTVLLCALLMAFAVAAAETAVLPTPDETAGMEDFLGEWAVYQGYVDGEWIDPMVGGAGVRIGENEIAFLTEGAVDFTAPCTYENGQLLCTDGADEITVFFGTDGMLYMYYPDDDMYISFGRDLTVDAPEAGNENPFIGEWEAAIVIMFGNPMLPSDMGFEIGMIVTETEAHSTNAGEVMSTETYVIEDGKAYLSDGVTVLFFDEYGLLHAQLEDLLDVICVPAERGIELPE